MKIPHHKMKKAPRDYPPLWRNLVGFKIGSLYLIQVVTDLIYFVTIEREKRVVVFDSIEAYHKAVELLSPAIDGKECKPRSLIFIYNEEKKRAYKSDEVGYVDNHEEYLLLNEEDVDELIKKKRKLRVVYTDEVVPH
jgi:hypothetical protein